MNNLFHSKGLGPLLRSPWTWRLSRILCLLLLLTMIACGWRQHAIPGVKTADPLMYTNMATYGFWVLWIMGVVVVAILFGRGWCAVCPLGWLNGLFARWGLQKPLPKALHNFVPVTLTLIALQLAVYFLAVHRYPDYTARLLALMILLAVGTGLIFRHRAFCRLFCPAGAVFGLYARVAPFRLQVQDQDLCAGCVEQSCVAGGELLRRFSLGRGVLFWRGIRPACPAELPSGQLGENPHCSLCLSCAPNCPQDNLFLGWRAAGEEEARGLSASETFFFLALLGLLTANFSKVFVALREMIFWAPEQAARLLGWQASGFYLLAAPWVTLVLPVLLLLPGYLVLRLSELKVETLPQTDQPFALPDDGRQGGGVRFWPAAGRLAIPYLPLLLAVHLTLAVVKLNAKGGYLPLVLRDPSGVKSYLAMNVMGTLSQPGVLLSLGLLKWLALALVLGGWLLALAVAGRAARRLYPAGRGRGYLAAAAVGVTLTASLYAATVIRWLFIR